MGTLRICSIEDCEREHKAKGLCQMHYLRFRKYGSPHVMLRPHKTQPTARCLVGDCARESYGLDLCRVHYRRVLRFNSTDLPKREAVACRVCYQPAHARELCSLHLKRWYTTGSTDDPVRPSDEERFWTKVNRGASDDCWEWQGSKHPGGHGYVAVGDKVTYAHRYSLEMHLGRPLQPGSFACHHCDNPPCVNPTHLYEGDAQTNVDDMIRRGRAHWQKGHRISRASPKDAA